MRGMWSALRSDHTQVQAAAARSVCSCINNPDTAGKVGQIFVGGMGVLVRLISTSFDTQVLGYCNLAIAKMATNETNSAILTEEGVLNHLAKVLVSSRDHLNHVIETMMYSNHDKMPSDEEISLKSFVDVFFEPTGTRKKMLLTSPTYNEHLKNILFVLANTAIAIGELCRFSNNRLKLYQLEVLEPLMDCLKLHSFMQQHFDANYHRNEFENAAMVEIMGRHQVVLEGGGRGRLHLMGIPATEVVTNPKLDDTSPYVCKSNMCAPGGDKSYSHDLDCYYHHIFRNTAYALSQLSEDETVAKTMRLCNSVSIMVKLLNSKNDALQLAAAKTISNIRRIHIQKPLLSSVHSTPIGASSPKR
jgi:uncharacterized protein (UPF0147 family)